MSRIKILFDVIEDIRSLSCSLQYLADALSSDEQTEERQEKESKASETSEQKAEESVKEESKTISLEEVRSVLAELSREGKTAEVREIIAKHGANKLSEVKPTEFAALLKEAEALKNDE